MIIYVFFLIERRRNFQIRIIRESEDKFGILRPLLRISLLIFSECLLGL